MFVVQSLLSNNYVRCWIVARQLEVTYPHITSLTFRHECSWNIAYYGYSNYQSLFTQEYHIPWGQRPRGIWYSKVNNFSYFLNLHAINVLLYRMKPGKHIHVKYCTGRLVTPLGHIILSSSQSDFEMTSYHYVLTGETANINYIVFGLTGQGLYLYFPFSQS
jgi:hypothetical protein